METAEMGRVLTEATLENLEDLWAVKRGLIPPDQVRRVAVADALADNRCDHARLANSADPPIGTHKNRQAACKQQPGNGRSRCL